jgi:hypothetical protein
MYRFRVAGKKKEKKNLDRVNVHNLAEGCKLAQSGKNVFGAAIVSPLSN